MDRTERTDRNERTVSRDEAARLVFAGKAEVYFMPKYRWIRFDPNVGLIADDSEQAIGMSWQLDTYTIRDYPPPAEPEQPLADFDLAAHGLDGCEVLEVHAPEKTTIRDDVWHVHYMHDRLRLQTIVSRGLVGTIYRVPDGELVFVDGVCSPWRRFIAFKAEPWHPIYHGDHHTEASDKVALCPAVGVVVKGRSDE